MPLRSMLLLVAEYIFFAGQATMAVTDLLPQGFWQKRATMSGFDLLKSPSGLKGDAAAAFEAMNLPFEVLAKNDQRVGDPADRFAGADVIVDALFGAGLDRPLSGPAAELVEAVNGSSAAIIAVDLPSGINGATGEIKGSAIKAHATVTFFLKKPGHLLFPGRGLCGTVTVAQIGIETGVLDTIGPAAFENTPDLWQCELAAPGGGWPQVFKRPRGRFQRGRWPKQVQRGLQPWLRFGLGLGSSLWHRRRTP